MRTLSLFNPIFDDSFSNFTDSFFENKPAKKLLSYDIKENEDHFRLFVDVPGVSKDKVNIEVKDQLLVISGERNSPFVSESDEEVSSRHSSLYGAFEQSFKLPNTIDFSKIAAKVEDGVLKIVLPKKESQKETKIQIGDNIPYLDS